MDFPYLRQILPPHAMTLHDPATLIQAQLDAYNAHDVAALLALYADDAQLFQHPSALLASGAAQIGARFSARFAANRPQATLLQRTVLGNTVIDHEAVRSFSPDAEVTMVAIYEVRGARIAQAWFLTGPPATA
ncbi:hypothetical protein AAKU55_005040 [Oxalobacteraceae bacterium GrIS 1.11]